VKLLFHIEATAELDAAVVWYEHEREGLGFELLEEVDRAFDVILESPTTWPFARPGSNLRRFVLTRFPYTLIYAESEELVRVFAVAHQKRRPGYWRARRF
jgi:toxin ParE1/3/4